MSMGRTLDPTYFLPLRKWDVRNVVLPTTLDKSLVNDVKVSEKYVPRVVLYNESNPDAVRLL